MSCDPNLAGGGQYRVPLEKEENMAYPEEVGRDPSADQAATAQGKDRHVEREFEIGKDEAWSSQMLEKDSNYFANRKRTYDEYQDVSLQTIRQARRQAEDLHHASLDAVRNNRSHFDKLMSDAQQHDNQRQAIANQALQNAVETANIVSKQSIRNSDLSTDRQWNINETDSLSAKSGVQSDALVAALATAIAKVMEQTASKDNG